MFTGEFFDLSDIVEVYGERFSWLKMNYTEEWFTKFISKFQIKYIQTQRLLTYENSGARSAVSRASRIVYQNTVEAYSKKLQDLFSEKDQEYSITSQKLDSTFPSRLLNRSGINKFNQETIAALEKKSKSLQKKLVDSGLIKKENEIGIELSSVSEEDYKAIYLYLQDSLKKLGVYQDLQKKINTFMNILNRKFEDRKIIHCSKENGIEIHSKKQQKIDPRQLSSGEQHEIILLYDLIFNATEGMLILIDEPEISLHIDWQADFLDDLRKINEFNL